MLYKWMRVLTFVLGLAIIATAAMPARGVKPEAARGPAVKTSLALAAQTGGCPASEDHAGCDHGPAARVADGGCCGGDPGSGGHEHGGGNPQAGTPPVPAKVENGVQTARIKVSSSGYQPARVSVKVRQPVRLIFVASASLGCAGQVVFPTLGLSPATLEAGGETVVKFTAPDAGVYPFSCPMGMVKGEIVVQ